MNQNDPNIDELLNSFLDGELTQKQQMEVSRLIADDEQIARRLRDLQNCKMLVASLPRAQAPADTLEQVKASFQDRTLDQQTLLSQQRERTRQLSGRRVLAVAAMTALIAVLATIIYGVFGPRGIADRPVPVQPVPSIADSTGFSGRLELRTGTLAAVDAFINRAIKDNDLSACVSVNSLADRRVYSFGCSRYALDLLLADLASIWERFDSAKLMVETPKFGEKVVVDAITAEQVAQILRQEHQDKAVRMAKDFAVLNKMAELLPGKEMLAATGDKKPSLITIPKPVLTGEAKTVKKAVPPEAGRAAVELTIVVRVPKVLSD